MKDKLAFNCIYSFFFLLFFHSQCIAQNQTGNLQIKVGEIVPDVFLGKIVNYTDFLPKKIDSLYLNDLNGKLVILDFWSAFCGTCIAKFPKLYDLQKEFGDKIIILPVGFSTQIKSGMIRGDIQRLVTSWRFTPKELRLPSTHIIEREKYPSDLSLLFPFNSVPTIVWIGADRRLIAVTSAQALTENTIRSLLGKKKVNLVQKKIIQMVDASRDFLIKRSSLKQDQLVKVAIGSFSDSLRGSAFRMDTSTLGYFHFYAVNASVLDLFLGAYSRDSISKDIFKTKKRTLIKGIDFNDNNQLDIFYTHNYDEAHVVEFLKNTYYSFEAFIPNTGQSMNQVYSQVKKELESIFSINSQVKKELKKCLVFRKASNWKVDSSTINGNNEFFLDNTNTLHFKGELVSLIEIINNKHRADIPLLVNGDSSLKFVSVDLAPNHFKNMAELSQAFRKKGIILREEMIELEMLILTKQKKETEIAYSTLK